MSVTRHLDPDTFLAAAEPLLARNLAIRSLVTAIADGWRAEPHALRDGYVATYAASGERGVALMRRGGPMLVENSTPDAARAFAHDVPDALRALTTVAGEEPACEAFAAVWNARFGTTHRLGVRMRHHVLTAVAAVPAAQGRYRAGTQADAAWLEERTLAFAAEARLTDRRELIIDGARRKLARGGVRIWDVDDVPVAFAGWSSAGAEVARIAPVYTEPFARGRGHATALVATLAAELLSSGRRALFLLTDLANPTSNALYLRIGFQPLSDTFRFDFIDPARASGG